MQITLTKSTKVRGVQTDAGQVIDCPEKEAKLWIALGMAREKTEEVVSETEDFPKRQRYQRRDMRARS